MLSRRGVLLAAASTVLMHARVARAQPPSKMLRVGFVGIQARDAALYKSFLGRMAELGYHEGRNFTFEYQQAPSIEGYEAAFRELATRKIDIFLAAGSEPSLRAVRAVAGTTPIAFLAIDFDPLAKGYVASLTRPGANITGILVRQIELAAKRIELVRQVFPTASRVGLLFDTASREQADSSADAAPQPRLRSGPDRGHGPAARLRRGSARDGRRARPADRAAGEPVIHSRPHRDRQRLARSPLAIDVRVPRKRRSRRTDELRHRPQRPVHRTSPTTSTGSRAARSRPRCRSSNRRGFSWPSTSRPRQLWAFRCRWPSPRAPTRCSNEGQSNLPASGGQRRRPLRLGLQSPNCFGYVPTG